MGEVFSGVLKQPDVRLLLVALIEIGLGMGSMMVSPSVGAGFIAVAIFIPIYIVLRVVRQAWVHTKPEPPSRAPVRMLRNRFVFNLLLPVAITLALVVPNYSGFVSFLEEKTGQLPNEYVIWTDSPDIAGGNHTHSLLVECGIRDMPTETANVTLKVVGTYQALEYWYAVADKTDRPQQGPPMGIIGIGRSYTEIDTTSPPEFSLFDPARGISRENSLYIYFTGTEPLEIKGATVNGITVSPRQR